MADKQASWFKRHKILTVVLGLILLVIIGGAASGGGDKTNTNSTDQGNNSAASESSAPAAEQVAKIGSAARDGKFEFTVKGVECGKATAGTNQYLTKTAQGQYCFLNVTVKNVGNEAQGLFSSNQKLLNAQNQEFAADDTATIYQSPDNGSAYNSINPGNSVEAVIVFDVPKGQTPTTAELHDSAFSGGVKVSLQ